MAQQRIYWIDWLKTFAIMLVVLGHCVQTTTADYDNNLLFRIIYSFHMPLFMSVSGYLSYKALMTFDVVKKRFVQLILPFVCWPIVMSIITWDFNDFGSLMLSLLFKPDAYGLWFLYTLFMITVLEYGRIKLVTICKISIFRGG